MLEWFEHFFFVLLCSANFDEWSCITFNLETDIKVCRMLGKGDIPT